MLSLGAAGMEVIHIYIVSSRQFIISKRMMDRGRRNDSRATATKRVASSVRVDKATVKTLLRAALKKL